MKDISTLPVVLELPAMSPEDFIAYFDAHRQQIDHILSTTGAVKFKGLELNAMADFQGIVNNISEEFMSYVDGNSPRTKLSGNVYTSTEYDKRQQITMHNELSYSALWPGRLYFSCLVPSETGGETLLADSREILRVMPADIVAEVSAKGICYVRNLHAGQGMGPTWQATFETDSREQVEAYCQQYNINYEWREDDQLRLRQFSKGIISHRHTGEQIWFNQLDQFHPSHLGEELYEIMQSIYESPENFPLNVQFGDGTPVSDELVKTVLATIADVTIAPVWDKHELLILDNELISHGRNPFTGERKVLVSMSR